MTEERVLWINAGGTIVSEPYDDPAKPPDNVKTLPLHEAEGLMLAVMIDLKVDDRVDAFALHSEQFNKDSKKFTDEDIFVLANIIKNDDHRLVLINHGTDWIRENGFRLKARLEELNVTDKTIVMVGAMVPLIMRSRYPSDALDNLKKTFDNIDTLSPGVYAVGRDAKTGEMKFFDPGQWEKDRIKSKEKLQLTFKRY